MFCLHPWDRANIQQAKSSCQNLVGCEEAKQKQKKQKQDM